MTWCYRLVASAAVVAVLGCGSDDSGSSSGAGGGGSGGGLVGAVTLGFSETSPLSVAPGQAVSLQITTDPPGAHDVTFLLLGDSLDASLSASVASTDPSSGAATVVLLAPSKAASFKVRAAFEGGEALDGSANAAELVVSVSELGTGSLRVVPEYAGNREIDTWHAAVVTQATCDDLSPPGAEEPKDALVGDADVGDDVIVEGAAVGPTLAVLVRSAHKVYGCVETALSHAGETKEITVPVLDRPVDLSKAELAIRLGLDAPLDDLESLLQAADEVVVDATFPGGELAASVLLDAMALELPPKAAAAFTEARAAGDIDAALAADLEARGVEPRSVIRGLLRAGRPLSGDFLAGRLSSADADASHALLRVATLAGVDAERAGVPTDHIVNFVANPGDQIFVSTATTGGIYFLPSRLVGALGEDAAAATNPDLATIGDVLADAFGCVDVADVVGPLGACDADCVVATCRAGLGDVWARGLDASATLADVGVLSLNVSGDGVVDDDAALVGFVEGGENTWVGVLQAVDLEANVGGAARAEASGGSSSSGLPSGAGGGGLGGAEPVGGGGTGGGGTGGAGG